MLLYLLSISLSDNVVFVLYCLLALTRCYVFVLIIAFFRVCFSFFHSYVPIFTVLRVWSSAMSANVTHSCNANYLIIFVCWYWTYFAILSVGVYLFRIWSLLAITTYFATRSCLLLSSQIISVFFLLCFLLSCPDDIYRWFSLMSFFFSFSSLSNTEIIKFILKFHFELLLLSLFAVIWSFYIILYA